MVLMLDSDEVLDKSQMHKINFLSKSTIMKKKYYCFLMPRIPFFENSVFKKTNLFPNFQPRLFYKSNMKGYIKLVHETPIPINHRLKQHKLKDIYIYFSAELTDVQIKRKFEYYTSIEKKMVSKNFFNSMHFIFNGFFVLAKMFVKILINKKSNKKIIVYEKKITLTRILMLYSLLVYKLNVFKKIN